MLSALNVMIQLVFMGAIFTKRHPLLFHRRENGNTDKLSILQQI